MLAIFAVLTVGYSAMWRSLDHVAAETALAQTDERQLLVITREKTHFDTISTGVGTRPTARHRWPSRSSPARMHTAQNPQLLGNQIQFVRLKIGVGPALGYLPSQRTAASRLV